MPELCEAPEKQRWYRARSLAHSTVKNSKQARLHITGLQEHAGYLVRVSWRGDEVINFLC